MRKGFLVWVTNSLSLSSLLFLCMLGLAGSAFAESNQSSVSSAAVVVTPISGVATPDSSLQVGLSKKTSDWLTQENSPMAENAWGMTKALLFCLGVLLVMTWGMKRWVGVKNANGGGQIKIIERAVLTPKTALYLVEVTGKRILVSAGPEPASVISDLWESAGDVAELSQIPCSREESAK